jgi:outer membrane lipoprotein-sorting protein
MIGRLGLLLFMLSFFAQAEDTLTQIRARLPQTEIVQGHFSQEKQLKFLSKPLVSQGEFVFWQNHGVLWKTLSPVASTLLINNSRLLSSQGEQAIPASFGRIFPALLGGDWTQLQADFNLSATLQAQSWQIELRPKAPLLAKVIALIYLSGDSELRQLEIHEVSGNQSIIRFDSIDHPDQLPPAHISEFERLSP